MILPFALGLLVAHATPVELTEIGHAYNPAWSPDGRFLAFELNRYEASIDLYVIKVQNGTPVGTPEKVDVPGSGSAFGGGGAVAAAPSWHPRGMLIFEGSTAGGTKRLFFWAPGGQKASELLSAAQVRGDMSWPAISPDGRRVAFISDATGNGDLYVWDRSTNKVEQAISSPFSEMAPRFAEDGARIAYTRKNRGGEDLFVFEDGRAVPRVGGNGDQTRPVWVGERIVFFTNERGGDHWDIAVSSGPGDKRVIARDVRLPLRAGPAITPDGRWVAYGVSAPEKAGSIYFTTVDGSRTVAVDTGMVGAGEPAVVEADGRLYLAFTALPSDDADWRQLHVIDITGRLQ